MNISSLSLVINILSTNLKNKTSSKSIGKVTNDLISLINLEILYDVDLLALKKH